MKKLIIQMPCLNEEGTLAIALKALPREVAGVDKVEWLIINDGSTDRTIAVARECGVDHIVDLGTHHGLARGFVAGLDAALRAGADIIVNTDADNQYNADDIPKLIEPILRGEAEIVVGARPITEIEHFSPLKKGLQKLGSWVVRAASGTDVADAPSGFRAMSRKAAMQLNVFSQYTYTLETIIQAGQKNMAIVSVPIRTNGYLRPSRLMKSMSAYIQRSILTILRIFITYKPLRFFLWLGAFPFAAGVALGVRWLYLYTQDPTRGREPSLILAAILILIGVQLWGMGAVADLIAVNRKLLEDIQQRVKRVEVQARVMSRELFAREALAQIPKILTLQDRNAHSPTYGCFDRNFWHYKIIDFPSGMAAEFVWPLALAYALPIAGNAYFHQPAIKQWAEAGMIYAARSAHPDGSCDDYFPFEKAAGAAAFSLLAAIESYTLLKLNNQELLDFFARRADWLADHHESGRLTNHQALIVLCLEKCGRLFESNRWDKLKAKRLKRVIEWQNEEGWFQEYEGCDPGYHTLTIGLLAQLFELTPSADLKIALQKAIYFAAHFVHPDGSFGGEYTSRNTYNYFPHGFEIAGKWLPEALPINDRFLTGLANGLGSCYADDHIIGHHTWSYLLAYQHWMAERPPVPPAPKGRVHFENAGIIIERRGPAVLYLALTKGGVFKFFLNGRLVLSDTQFSAQVEDGRVRVAVAHLVGKNQLEIGEDQITIAGKLGWAKNKQMTTFNLVVLRALMFTVGRFFPDLIRKLLQKILITGKKAAPLEFRRTLAWRHEQLTVTDELAAASWDKVRAVGIGAAQTSIYVVMSRTWQAGQLQPWLDLTAQMKALKPGEPLRLERTL